MFFCVDLLLLSGNRDLFDTYYIYIDRQIDRQICIKKIPISREKQLFNTKKHESNEFNSTNYNFTRLQQIITQSNKSTDMRVLRSNIYRYILTPGHLPEHLAVTGRLLVLSTFYSPEVRSFLGFGLLVSSRFCCCVRDPCEVVHDRAEFF